jgi:glycosyltransferase involved in cell wall biosynthesis
VPAAALVTTTWPVPCDLGKKVVLNGIVEYLVDRLGSDDVHVVLLGPRPSGAPSLPCRVHHLAAPAGLEQLWATACGLRRHRSLQEAVLAAPRVATQLRAHLDDLGADLEIFDTIRVGQFAQPDGRASRRVLHLGDLFSIRYERWMSAIDAGLHAGAEPLGEFATLLPRAVRGPVGHWRVYRKALDVERRLVVRREQELVHQFHRTTLVSEEEAASLRERSGSAGVASIPPAVPGPVHVDRPPTGPPRFLFLGHLGVPHNADALTNLLATGPAWMRRACPDAELVVVGRGASRELRSHAATWGSAVTLREFVPDLAPLLARSTALLAPLRWGSGVKLKVLVALAHGCPVLGTSIAAQAIAPTTCREGVVVEDDLSAWPGLLRELTDPAVNARNSAAARAMWEETYAPESAFGTYDRVFGLGEIR